MFPKFYVGQKVIALVTYNDIKKGQEYTVTGVYKNCSCGHDITVGIILEINGQHCSICRKDIPIRHERQYMESRFAPKEEISEFQAITFEKIMKKEQVCVN